MERTQQADLLDMLARDYREILRGSNQAIVIFVDEESQVSNAQFASLLGFESIDEWSGHGSVLTALDNEARNALEEAHRRAVEDKVASIINVSWSKRDGEVVGTQVIIVPLPYRGSIHSIWFVNVNETTGTFRV